jgi:PIN domain nuclease of toxin-antitoxin system
MLLMDTHVWFWSLTEPGNLSKAALDILQRTETGRRSIASISIWEFAMMVARGRIEIKMTAEQWLDYAVHKAGLRVLELTPKVAIESCELPGDFHRDPADRIIVATARVNGATLVTRDQKILGYPHVKSIW